VTAAPPTPPGPPAGVDELIERLGAAGYLCDRRLATVIFVALRIGKPLFLEGEAGVGKTEAALAMAGVLGARLIRLQCYEGIDLAHAAYEWNYARQLLHIRLLGEADTGARARAERDLFSEEFLLRRPLLDAIDNRDEVAPVLLIDEIDRSDEEFEAFLLEVLNDFTISIPELGTVRARRRPLVVVTGNRTREVHDALKRRCLYHWIDYPDLEREVAIVRVRAPEVGERLARQVTGVVQELRGMDLYKLPGVAETVDWARAVAVLAEDGSNADAALLDATMGAAVKYQEDLDRVRAALPDLVSARPPT
jgi:MoxR-like ATPase